MLKELITGFGMTFALTIACFVTATLIAALTCGGFCAKNAGVRMLARMYNAVVIKIPPLVMLMLFTLLLTGTRDQGSVWVAYVGLSLFVAANLTGVFYGGVCSVAEGEIEAARTMGMSEKQTFFHIMLPQILQSVAPVYMSMFVMCMQITSVASVIGVKEFLGVAGELESAWLAVGLSFLVYFLIGILGDAVIARAAKRKHISVHGGKTI